MPSTSGRSAGGLVSKAAWRALLQTPPPPQRSSKHPRPRWLRSMRKPQGTMDEVRLHQEAMALSRSGQSRRALELLLQGQQRFPDNVFFPHSAAVLHDKSGRYEQAKALFEAALAVSPTNGASLQALAIMEAKQGHATAARELFQRASEVDPQHTPTWCAWALFERREGDTRRARHLFRTALSHNPQHEPTLNAFARLEMDANHWDSARELLQSVLTANPTHAHSWTVLGELCYRQGDFEQGRQMFESCMRHCGEDSVVCASWAALEARVGDTARARRLLERSLQLDRFNMHAWLLLAGMQARASNTTAALRTYRTALQIDPTNTNLQHAFGQFLITNGQAEQAERMLLPLASKLPCNGWLWYTLGSVALRRGELPLAAARFKCGLKDTNAEGALLNYEELAALAAQERRFELAREMFNRGASAHPPNSRFLRMWGLFEKRMQEWERARALFRASLDCDAMDVKTWMHWGLLERRLGNTDHALYLLNESLKIMPKNYHVWYLYCETAMQGKPPPECRVLFERAIEHAPRSPQLHLMRATLEWKAGNTAAARAFFEAGAQHARGSPLFYGPLFEAWSQFEDSAGEALRASELMAEHLEVCAAEQAEHRSRAGPLEGGEDALDSVLVAYIDGMVSKAR